MAYDMHMICIETQIQSLILVHVYAQLLQNTDINVLSAQEKVNLTQAPRWLLVYVSVARGVNRLLNLC